MAKKSEADAADRRGLKRDVLLLLLGGFIALSGSVATTYVGDYLQRQARQDEDRQSQLALTTALQAEIEANLLLMNGEFENYYGAVVAGTPLRIQPFRPAVTVFRSSTPRLGELADLALVSEIVAFYSGLEMLQAWSDTVKEAPQEIAQTYAANFAGVLGASLYLQARMAALTNEKPRHLGLPQLNASASQRFAAVTDLRQRLGHRIHETLRFHPADAEKNH